jgi:hypothetical protein
MTCGLVPLKAQTFSVNPALITRPSLQTQQFTLSGAGAPSAVTWSLDPPTGVGTISSTGLFTAPGPISVLTTVRVIATSTTDATKVAEAAVRLAALSINVTPGTSVLTISQSKQFTTSINPAGVNQQVTWTVDPAGLGFVSGSGLYVAPAALAATQTVRVVATSVADPAKSDVAVVTLNPLNLTVAPLRATMTVAQTRQFTADSNNGPATVTWSVDPPGRGTDSSSGLYTRQVQSPLKPRRA